MKWLLYFITLIMFLLNMSCISSYNAISPTITGFSIDDVSSEKGMSIQINKDNLLLLNIVFDKKAQKKGIRLVSVQIENNTDSLVMLRRDNLEVFSNFESVKLLSPEQVVSKIGYNLIGRGALVAGCIAGSFQFGSISAGLINFYSPFLYSSPFSLYYFTRSLISNKKFKRDIEKYDPENKIVNPGEKIYCILAFESDNQDELLIRFKK